jgi:hypothetical protein
MRATVNLHLDGEPPIGRALTLDDGQQFILVDVGGVSLILHDHDAVAVAQARALSAALLSAAEEIDARLTQEPALLAEVQR